MIYRRLFHPDANQLYELRIRSLTLDPVAFGMAPQEEQTRGVSFYEKHLRAVDQNAIFGAYRDSQLRAMLCLARMERFKAHHRAILWGVFVEQEARKQGAAARLLDLAIHHARTEMKIRMICLSVTAMNESARRLYESRGFSVWGTDPSSLLIDGQFYSEHQMTLDLQNVADQNKG